MWVLKIQLIVNVNVNVNDNHIPMYHYYKSYGFDLLDDFFSDLQ